MNNSPTSNNVRSTALESASGFRVSLLDLGASLQSIIVPTPGGPVNCVLGYQDPGDYCTDQFYVGVTVGRYASRLRDARIHIENSAFQLDGNEVSTGHCLHGGRSGFHRPDISGWRPGVFRQGGCSCNLPFAWQLCLVNRVRRGAGRRDGH